MFKEGSPGARARTKIPGRVERDSANGATGAGFCRLGGPTLMLVRRNELCWDRKGEFRFQTANCSAPAPTRKLCSPFSRISLARWIGFRIRSTAAIAPD